MTVDGRPADADLGIEVMAPEAPLSGERARIANFWRVSSGHITFLPAGSYLVTARLADQQEVRGEIQLMVGPGEEKPVAMDLSHE